MISKALENGGAIAYSQLGKLIAIGSGHKAEVVEALASASEGAIKITKGVLADPGTLEASGPADRTEFKDAMKRISKKKVVYSFKLARQRQGLSLWVDSRQTGQSRGCRRRSWGRPDGTRICSGLLTSFCSRLTDYKVQWSVPRH